MVLKCTMNNSMRCTGKNTHLSAAHSFVYTHGLDHRFEKFWRQRLPDGAMLLLVRSKDRPDISTAGSTKKPSPWK